MASRVQAIRRQSQMPYEFVYQLADGKDGTFDKQIIEAGAVQPLIAMLLQVC